MSELDGKSILLETQCMLWLCDMEKWGSAELTEITTLAAGRESLPVILIMVYRKDVPPATIVA